MLDIRPLRHEDLMAALNLSIQAGWNQLAADWQRLLELWPGGCWAGWESGRLIATATLATYGQELGWVGMVLVDERYRGRGVGGAMLDALIVRADQQGIRRLGLDATDAGRPVYLKRGFRDAAGIARWIGHVPSRPPTIPSLVLTWELTPPEWTDLLALDAAAVGADRGMLLRHLAGEPGGGLAAIRVEDRLAAVAFTRPGRQAAFIGPVVACASQAARNLVLALLGGFCGVEGVDDHKGFAPGSMVMLDMPTGSCLEAPLAEAGFRPQRRLMRMFREAAPTAAPPKPLSPALAGFELG